MHGEMDRPEHKILHKRIPEGHAHMDQKLQKGMRSPILSQFPEGNGENPQPGDSTGGLPTGEGY